MSSDNMSVSARRAAVRAQIVQREARAIRGDMSPQMDWKFFNDHQPEGGVDGAPCLGKHETSTPWPCESFATMENPQFYMD